MFAIEFARLLGPTVGRDRAARRAAVARGGDRRARDAPAARARAAPRDGQRPRAAHVVARRRRRSATRVVPKSWSLPASRRMRLAPVDDGGSRSRIRCSRPRCTTGSRRGAGATCTGGWRGSSSRSRNAAATPRSRASTQDAETAALVAEAADAAAARGALQAAAELAAEVARVTPDAGVRRERLIEAAAYLVDTGEFAAARDMLDPLLAEELPPVGAWPRAARPRRGRDREPRGAHPEPPGRPRGVRRRARALAGADPPRAARHWITGDGAGAVETRAGGRGGGARDSATRSLSRRATARSRSTRPRSGSRRRSSLSRRARPPRAVVEHRRGPVPRHTPHVGGAPRRGARRAAVHTHDRLARAGQEARAGFVLITRSEIELRAGRWDDAGQGSGRGDGHPRRPRADCGPPPHAARRTRRGERRRRLGADILEWTAALVDRYSPLRVRWSLGQLELAPGRRSRGRAPVRGGARAARGGRLPEPRLRPDRS